MCYEILFWLILNYIGIYFNKHRVINFSINLSQAFDGLGFINIMIREAEINM